MMHRLHPGFNIEDSNRLIVRLGLHNQLSPEKHSIAFGYEGYLTVFIHEKYDNKSLENDIALITLDRKVPITKYIRPICLPPIEEKNTLKRNFLENEANLVYIAGYIKTLINLKL